METSTVLAFQSLAAVKVNEAALDRSTASLASVIHLLVDTMYIDVAEVSKLAQVSMDLNATAMDDYN